MSTGIVSRPGGCGLGVALIVLLLHGSACEGPADERPLAGAERPAVPASPEAPASAVPRQAEPPQLPAPPEGSVIVWASARGVSALANRAPVRAVLEELARESGFELEIAQLEKRARVTLRARDARTEEVLAEALRGIPYSLDFGSDPDGGAGALLRVRVGRPADDPAKRVAAALGSPTPRDEADREPRVITAGEVERRAAQLEELQAEILAQMEDPDATTRAEAARWLQPDVEGLAVAERLLAVDPSPDVRAAAAESLADGDSVGAVSVLLGALDDPDPRVVMAALDALEFAGDATIIPALSPLLQHRDVAVRERTIEAIEFLE